MRRVLFACLFVCAFRADAVAELRLTHYTTSNGLPQNTVSAIAQTRDGYLWFGTYDGLVRYDGVRFTIFDKGNTPGIRSNQIISIREDSEGTLWIGTGEGGLIRYRHGVFTSFTTSEGLPDNYVGRLENTPDGLIVFMRGVPHRWTGEKAVPLDPIVLSEFIDSRGARWTRRVDRLVRTSKGRETSFPFALTRDEFAQRYEDPTGALWFSGAQERRLPHRRRQPRALRHERRPAAGRLDPRVRLRSSRLRLAVQRAIDRPVQGRAVHRSPFHGFREQRLHPRGLHRSRRHGVDRHE